MQYCIVRKSSAAELAAAVDSMMDDNIFWKPHGAIVIEYSGYDGSTEASNFYQAMLKEEV